MRSMIAPLLVAEGWSAANHLDPLTVAVGVLSSVSNGDDPYMESAAVRFPGPAHPMMVMRMGVDAAPGSTLGQIFFLTEDDPNWSEDKSVTFPITIDGETRDYEVDLSTAPGWDAIITRVRIDPGAVADATIEIDSIGFR